MSYESPYEPPVEGEELPYIVTDEEPQGHPRSSEVTEAGGAKSKLQEQPSTSSSSNKKRSPRSPRDHPGDHPGGIREDSKPPREKRSKEKRSKKSRSDHSDSNPPDNSGSIPGSDKKSKEKNVRNPRHPISSRSDSQRKSIRRQAKVDSDHRDRNTDPRDLSDVFDEEDSVADLKYEEQRRKK